MLDDPSKPKAAVIASAVAAGIVALATLSDLACGFPFRGRIWFDLSFLIGACCTLLMARETWHDLQPHARRARRHASSEARAARSGPAHVPSLSGIARLIFPTAAWRR